jgi:hypothetical protein
MASLKIPKRWNATARTAFDPMGVDPLNINDKIFGEQKGPDYSAEEQAQAQAIADMQGATNEFISGGPAQYGRGETLGVDQLGASRMDSISTDPRYSEFEMAALKDLEDQSKNGFTAADRADMARVESDVNRQNRGRQGAIMQNMQARGMGGSGMDLVAQMQSAQDANEIASLKALEQEGMMQNRKQAATGMLGDQAGRLQGRDFNQAAMKAQAADQIARFNSQNSNQAMQNNWNRGNQTLDNNARAQYDFNRDRLGAKQAQSGVNYDFSVEGQNNKMLADQAAEKKRAGAMGGLMGAVGGIVGGIYGGPQGAASGAQVGQGAGGAFGSTAYRNNTYRSDEACKENIQSEHPLEIEAFIESLAPKSYDYKQGEGNKHGVVAQDLEKTNIGRSMVKVDDEGMKNISIPDAIGSLLQAVSHLNKKMKG